MNRRFIVTLLGLASLLNRNCGNGEGNRNISQTSVVIKSMDGKAAFSAKPGSDFQWNLFRTEEAKSDPKQTKNR
jgi:hypothetical protein